MSFVAETHAISQQVAARMSGVSWHPKLPGGFVTPSFEELRLLELSHRTFDGRSDSGQLVVHASVAVEVVAIFREIHEAGFPIERMQPVWHFGADDERSMAANNTSGFNCRVVAGTRRPSAHARGLAIDINPIQNPYIVGAAVHPQAASAYLDREHERSGMLTPHGPVVRAFLRAGWRWGGNWTKVKDYHHFEKTADTQA